MPENAPFRAPNDEYLPIFTHAFPLGEVHFKRNKVSVFRPKLEGFNANKHIFSNIFGYFTYFSYLCRL